MLADHAASDLEWCCGHGAHVVRALPPVPSYLEANVGTRMLLASTIRLSPGTNLFFYVAIWVACIAGIGIVAWAALRSKRWPRWTTQDILIVAALGVLLEVYDNIIGDQFITPLLGGGNSFLHFLQIHDLPYMFLLMVGVALVRKPGCVTAMIFINFLLAALLFG